MWITFADFRQMHDAVVNMTKIVLHVFGADGNEIGGVAAVIPPGRADAIRYLFWYCGWQAIKYRRITLAGNHSVKPVPGKKQLPG